MRETELTIQSKSELKKFVCSAPGYVVSCHLQAMAHLINLSHGSFTTLKQ
jgi:hypothetical protein